MSWHKLNIPTDNQYHDCVEIKPKETYQKCTELFICDADCEVLVFQDTEQEILFATYHHYWPDKHVI